MEMVMEGRPVSCEGLAGAAEEALEVVGAGDAVLDLDGFAPSRPF
jgi:hypothetical protein